MNATTIRGHWNVIKGRLKKRYAQLTDNDLLYVEGREEELVGKIQEKVGATRQEIERLFDEVDDGD